MLAKTGVVRGQGKASRSFDIRAGVRQGCVLGPRLYCATFQLAVAGWRGDAGLIGLDLRDGSFNLLDFRLADDIFATLNTKAVGCLTICSAVVVTLACCLMWTTMILTTEAQPPSQLYTPNGLVVDILSGLTSHKWLGCQLSSMGSADTQNNVQFHLNAASRASYANRHALCDRSVSILERLT